MRSARTPEIAEVGKGIEVYRQRDDWELWHPNSELAHRLASQISYALLAADPERYWLLSCAEALARLPHADWSSGYRECNEGCGPADPRETERGDVRMINAALDALTALHPPGLDAMAAADAVREVLRAEFIGSQVQRSPLWTR